jgi:cell division protein FtsW
VVFCFLAIALRGLRIASRAPEPFAALLATGITGWLVFQAVMNMAVVTSMIPFTGLTLPFLSYGGTSLMFSMIAAGILLNISRYTTDTRAESDEQLQDSRQRNSIAHAVAVWWRDRWARLSGSGGRRRTRRAWGVRRF